MQEELSKVWGGWELKELLGEGSFGKVYRIERKEFGHTYEAALKLITIPKNQSEIKSILNDGMDEHSATMYFRSIVEDIVEEFALMSQLKGNTNIVSYEDHAVIPHEEGIGWNIYIRMELLIPLFDYLRDHELSIRDVIRLGIDMCNALEICQKYNIIHRDIKPENMFVSDLGKFKLGDFGIARQLEKTSSGLSKKGTYTYMAPEVYKGEKYNSTVDIYSLGIVLYRFLNNNRTPFLPAYPNPIRYSDKEKANVMRMSGKEMPNPCNAEGRLAEIVLKACAYDPKDRYESAVDMKKALEAVLYEEPEAQVIYPDGDDLPNNSVEYIDSENEKKDDVFVEKETENAKEENDVENSAPVSNNVVDETEHTFYMFRQAEELRKKAKAEEEARQKAEAEAKAKAEEAEKARIEAEAKRKAEETEKARAEAAEKARIEAEAKKKAEEAKRKAAEEARKKEETEAKRQAREAKMKEMAPGIKKAMIAVAAVVILFGAFKGGQNIYQKSLEREVPRLVNMTLEEAEKKAGGEDGSLSVKTAGEEYSDTVPKGKIISQNIEAGTILKKGDEIEVIVSGGKLILIPNLEGKTEQEAMTELQTSGLSYLLAERKYSDTVPKGSVLSQTPEAGMKVEEGTQIGVTLSDGIEQVSVPNVKGISENKAKKRLEEAKLKCSVSREYSDTVAEDDVISQSVEPGKTVNKNKKVKLVVSMGKKPAPAPTPNRTPSSNSSNKKKKPSGGGSDNIDSWDLIN